MKTRTRPKVELMEGRTLLSAGALDTSFGGTGMVSTLVSPGTNKSSSVAVQSDLKVVAYGINSNGGPNQIEVVRYTVDGSLDATFGTAGKVVVGSASASSSGHALVIQPDGKVVLIGTVSDPKTGNSDFEVVRLNANGGLDATFGGGTGKVVTAVTPQNNAAAGLALQADGKIVVAGQWYAGSGKTGGFEVVRYNTDGSLDATFGTGGVTVVSPAKMLPGTFPQVDTLAIDSTGRIDVVGNIPYLLSGGSQYYEAELLRFTAGGRLDTTFGSAGQVTLLPPGANASEFRDVGFQSTGKIVAVAGGSLSPNALVRYNIDGSLDTTFGRNGFSPLSSQVASWNPFAVEADDKIVVGCGLLVNGSQDPNAWVMRVLADGTAADPTFGTGGLAEAAFGGRVLTRGIAIGPDGKIVLSSFDQFAHPSQFRIARFLGDTPPAGPHMPPIPEADSATMTPNATRPDPAVVPLVLDAPDLWDVFRPLTRRRGTS